MQLFVFLLSDRSEQVFKLDGCYNDFSVLELKRRRGDHGSVKLKKNNYPGEGPTTIWAVHLLLHRGVIRKSFGVKSVVCHRLLRGRFCVECWYAIGCVQSVGVQSVRKKLVVCVASCVYSIGGRAVGA